jgi:hypothetical protein
VSAASLVALIFMLPLVDAMPESFLAARIVAYALVLVSVALLLHGFFVAAGGYETPRLLALGAVSGALGLSSAFLARPEDLESSSGVFVLLGVCFAAFLAVTAGLLLQRPLPALPFIAIAFVLVNADLIVVSLAKRGKRSFSASCFADA